MSDVYAEADLYCTAFGWPVGDEVDWLLERTGGAGSVLEPFCGAARYAEAFADRGVCYTGFDLEPAMLARAPQRPGVTVLRADARAFTLPGGPRDLAWCPINSVRHLLEADDVVAHLRCVRDHLAPGAAYVVESDLMRHDGPWPKPPDDKSVWTTAAPDGTEVRATWFIDRCDLRRRRVWERARLERVEDGTVTRRVETVYEMRLYTADDWPRIAAEGGFAIEAVHAHRSGNRRPRVDLSPALENTGDNHYLVLRA